MNKMNNAKLVIIRGLPGSGKSTFAKDLQYLNTDLYHYESDAFLMENSGYIWTPHRIKQANNACFIAVKDLLSKNCSVVVSNCFIRNKSLKRYADLVDIEQLFIIEIDSQYNSIHNLSEETFNNIKKHYQPLGDKFESRRIKFESTIYSEKVLQVSRIIRKEV